MANDNPYSSQLTPITGIPERVGLPVEAIKEVGANLTQRYWAAKENVSKINSAIANIPMYDKEVDSKILQPASQYINDSFKKVIENDDWYNATDTIMEVSNKLSTDPNLKALTNNVAALQQSKAELEKRYEKEPSLRQYEAWVDAQNRINYRKQGGSMSSDGKPQNFTPFIPTTSMDLSPFVKHIEDVASKMKAVKDAYISNPGTFNPAGIEKLEDPTIRDYFKKMYQDKVSVASLTTNRIEEAAKQIILNDPNYHKTNLEIQQAQHFLQTGKLEPTKEDLSALYKNNSPYEKQLSLQLSPTYKSEFEKIQNEYLINVAKANGNRDLIKHANNVSQQKINALNNNPNIYNEGHEKLLNLIEPEISNLYYGIKTNAVTNSIIKSGNAFAYTEKDVDRNIIDTGSLTDALLKQKEGNLIAPNVIGTNPISIPLDPLNPTSQSDFMKVEAAYNAAKQSGKGIPSDLELKYKIALNTKNAATQAIASTYNSLSPDEKNSVLNSANPYISKLFGADAEVRYSLFNKTKKEDINTLNKLSEKHPSTVKAIDKLLSVTNPISYIINVLGGEKSSDVSKRRAKYLFSSLHPEQVINQNSDNIIQNAMSNGMVLSPKDITYFKQQFDKAKYDIGIALQNHKGTTLTVPTRDIVSIGAKNPIDKALDLNIGSSLYNGTLIDITGKAWTKDVLREKVKANNGAEGYIDYRLGSEKSLNTNDLNNLGEFSVNEVNNGGAYLSSSPTFKLHVPVRNDKNQIVGYTDIVAPYEGNNALVKAKQVQYIKDAATHFKKESTGDVSRNAALLQLNTMGQHVLDAYGNPIQQSINTWKQNMDGNKVLQLNETNSLNIHPNKDKNGVVINYTITPHIYDKNINAAKKYDSFTVKALDDIPTYIGGKSAIDAGLNPETIQPLMYSLTHQE